MRIKKDDTVIVIAGKDKGATGKVSKVFPKQNRVVVEGVNVQTKHQKQTRTAPAEIRHVEGPIETRRSESTEKLVKKTTKKGGEHNDSKTKRNI